MASGLGTERDIMSFRNRLTLFFVVIVIVPMIVVTAVLFRLISDNEMGKADAGLVAQGLVVTRLYAQEVNGSTTAQAADRVARDPQFGASLSAGNLSQARARAQQLLGASGAVRIGLVRSGRLQLDVGSTLAIAPALRDLVDSQGRALGRLEVSVTLAKDFVAQVRALTGLTAVVHDGPAVLATSAPALASASLPPPGRAISLRRAGIIYRAASLPVRGFGAAPLEIGVLSDQQHISARVSSRRLLAGALIAAFFLVAVGLALLVSRQLQRQIGGFLDAARCLGRGDFSAQVPVAGRDEFSALGHEFNKMSHQLEERMREIADQQGQLEGALRRIGDAFAANLDRDALLEIMLRTAVDTVDADGGRASARAEDMRMITRAHVGLMAVDEAVLEQVESEVLASGEPRRVDLEGASALSHPLMGADGDRGMRGLLSVIRHGRPFGVSEGELFHHLASQAAVSIENVDLHERVSRQATTDGLTGLQNHRRFQETMGEEAARSRRSEQPLGLAMIDIDDFKRINDAHGHQQGDLVLCEVAHVLRACSREIDSPARYGGEELAVVLPQTDGDGAHRFAERVRSEVEALSVPILTSDGTLSVTISVGTASRILHDRDEARALIAAADFALYEAKRAGKNKTVRAH